MARLRQIVGEWFRFGCVGILATLTYLVSSLVADTAGFVAYVANLAGYIASMAVSYFGHSFISFRATVPHQIRVLRFGALSLLTYCLTNLIIFAVVDILGYAFTVATFLVACSIPALTWLISRCWVYRETGLDP